MDVGSTCHAAIINLTPHALNIIDKQNNVRTLPPDGRVARVRSEVKDADPLPNLVDVLDETGVLTWHVVFVLPTVTVEYGGIEGLPEPIERVAYITSTMVAEAAWREGRKDVFAPGELVRGDGGQPVGCLGLKRNPNQRAIG